MKFFIKVSLFFFLLFSFFSFISRSFAMAPMIPTQEYTNYLNDAKNFVLYFSIPIILIANTLLTLLVLSLFRVPFYLKNLLIFLVLANSLSLLVNWFFYLIFLPTGIYSFPGLDLSKMSGRELMLLGYALLFFGPPILLLYTITFWGLIGKLFFIKKRFLIALIIAFILLPIIGCFIVSKLSVLYLEAFSFKGQMY